MKQWIVQLLDDFNLKHLCNDFEYQRYGKGKNEEGLELPYIISNPVDLFNSSRWRKLWNRLNKKSRLYGE